jgi:outer membrane receptor protein involved in Fe transport
MSLTAARRLDARYGTDLDLGPQPLLSGAPHAKQEQFSQEFQLQSAESSRVRWVAGLYLIGIDERYDPTIFRYGGAYSERLGGRILQTLESAGMVSSYAGYGQATVPLGEATRVTGGLRYTIEKRSARARGEQRFDRAPFVRPIPGLPLLTEEPLRDSETFRQLSWRASLDYDVADDILAYASLSRGFQSGGWNLQTPQNPAFDEERVDDLEVGLKFADRSLGVEADLGFFYYNYADLQVSAITPAGSATTNATSAEIYGLELQLGLRPGERTDVAFGGQWLSARYNRFENATCTDYDQDAAVPYLPGACDVTDNRLPLAPRFKLNLGANHRVPLGATGTVILSGNLSYNSGYFSEPDNVVQQDAFTTIDLTAEWRPVRPGPSLRLWALNLTGTRYSDSLVTFPTTGVLQRPAAPRRLGASVEYSF